MPVVEWLRRHRFELFHLGLAVVGVSLAASWLPSVLVASSVAEIPPFSAIAGLAGVALAIASVRDLFARDRDAWARHVEDREGIVWLGIAAGLMAAGGLAFLVVSAA